MGHEQTFLQHISAISKLCMCWSIRFCFWSVLIKGYPDPERFLTL